MAPDVTAYSLRSDSLSLFQRDLLPHDVLKKRNSFLGSRETWGGSLLSPCSFSVLGDSSLLPRIKKNISIFFPIRGMVFPQAGSIGLSPCAWGRAGILRERKWVVPPTTPFLVSLPYPPSPEHTSIGWEEIFWLSGVCWSNLPSHCILSEAYDQPDQL